MSYPRKDADRRHVAHSSVGRGDHTTRCVRLADETEVRRRRRLGAYAEPTTLDEIRPYTEGEGGAYNCLVLREGDTSTSRYKSIKVKVS